MTRAICTTFHSYTPFGKEYYTPLFDFYMMQMEKYKDEFDKLYLLDSNWGIKKVPEWVEVIQVNPHDRYYDAYRKNLHKIKEDLVLFLDNDMVIYRRGVILDIFATLTQKKTHWDYLPNVVSIYDTIGKTFKELGGKSKFCPYLFATRTELLMKYRNVEWGPNMPEHETLGKLTEVMLKDGLKPYEMEEDKSDILISGVMNLTKGKDLGYYHIRSGSVPALLLAWRNAGDVKMYFDYLKNQPHSEYVRQIAWFWYICYKTKNEKVMQHLTAVLKDVDIKERDWYTYFRNFTEYHGLEKSYIGLN